MRVTRFVEPSEGAFTLSVPEGWQVQAGVVRGGSDPRPWYRVRSPSFSAELRGSDPRVPPSFLDLGGAGMFMPVPMPVRPLIPPAAFAEEYAHHWARELGAPRFERSGFRGIEDVLNEDPRPETRPRVMLMTQNGALFGGVTFSLPDRDLQGMVDVCILRMPMLYGMVWSPFVTALIGPSAEWQHVKATLLWIAQSFKIEPAWQQGVSQMQQMQHQMAMDTIHTGTQVMNIQAQSGMDAIRAHADRARMAAQNSAEISAMQSNAWRSRQAASDEQQRRAVNSIRGTADVQDPESGRIYRDAPAGYATYWTDGADRVVASEGQENPDASTLREAVNLDDLRGPNRPPGSSK